MKMDCTRSWTEVKAFCESIADAGTTNLRLLEAIDQTIDWLGRIQRNAQADTAYAISATNSINGCKDAQPIETNSIFEHAENVIVGLYENLKTKRDVARRAPELAGQDRSQVVAEYDGAIAAIADLHNALVEFRWAIMEHNADFGKVTGSFSNAKDLRRHLMNL